MREDTHIPIVVVKQQQGVVQHTVRARRIAKRHPCTADIDALHPQLQRDLRGRKALKTRCDKHLAIVQEHGVQRRRWWHPQGRLVALKGRCGGDELCGLPSQQQGGGGQWRGAMQHLW